MMTGILLTSDTWPPSSLSAIRGISLLLPLEFRRRPWAIYSSLPIVVVSTTPMWDVPCSSKTRSSHKLTHLNFLFIHGLSCLLRRFTNPTLVWSVLLAMKLRSFRLSNDNMFPGPRTITIWSLQVSGCKQRKCQQYWIEQYNRGLCD